MKYQKYISHDFTRKELTALIIKGTRALSDRKNYKRFRMTVEPDGTPFIWPMLDTRKEAK